MTANRADVAALVIETADEMAEVLADAVVGLREAVYRELRTVVAVGLYEANVPDDVLVTVLRQLDRYAASALRIATPTTLPTDRSGIAAG